MSCVTLGDNILQWIVILRIYQWQWDSLGIHERAWMWWGGHGLFLVGHRIPMHLCTAGVSKTFVCVRKNYRKMLLAVQIRHLEALQCQCKQWTYSLWEVYVPDHKSNAVFVPSFQLLLILCSLAPPLTCKFTCDSQHITNHYTELYWAACIHWGATQYVDTFHEYALVAPVGVSTTL